MNRLLHLYVAIPFLLPGINQILYLKLILLIHHLLSSILEIVRKVLRKVHLLNLIFFLPKKSLSSLSENDFIFGTSASFTSSSTPSLGSSLASSPTPTPEAATSNLVIYASSNSSLSPSTSSEVLFPSSPSSTSTSSTGSDHVYVTIPELVPEEVAKNNDNLDSPAPIFNSPWTNWLNKQKEQKKLEDFNLG